MHAGGGIGNCSGYFQWQLVFYKFNDTLDGFHKKRRTNQEKANEPSSYYCHDKGYFKRSSSDLLMNITKTKVSKVWTWILLQTNLICLNSPKRVVNPAGISLPSHPYRNSVTFKVLTFKDI